MGEVTIRAATADDLPAFARLLDNPDAVKNTLRLPLTSQDEREDGVTSTASNRNLVAEVDGEVAGFGALRLFGGRRAHAGQISLTVDPAFVQADIAATLLQGLIGLGERWYGIRRFEVKIFTDDRAALHVYEQAGFEIEATNKQFALREGEYADAYTMARLHD